MNPMTLTTIRNYTTSRDLTASRSRDAIIQWA